MAGGRRRPEPRDASRPDHGPGRTGKAGASLRSEEPGRGARVHSMRRWGAPCDPPKAWTESGSLREVATHVSALAPLPASQRSWRTRAALPPSGGRVEVPIRLARPLETSVAFHGRSARQRSGHDRPYGVVRRVILISGGVNDDRKNGDRTVPAVPASEAWASPARSARPTGPALRLLRLPQLQRRFKAAVARPAQQ